MSTTSSSEDLLLDQIAEEFEERLRNGEQPTPSEYARQYPQLAEHLLPFLKTITELVQTQELLSHEESRTPQPPETGPDLQIIELIGSGGMGSVWKAHQLSLDRPVAIKVLQHQTSGWGNSSQRFLEEARIASLLVHDHIVPVHEIHSDAPRPWFIMQFIEGCSLATIIDLWKQQRGSARRKSSGALTPAPSPSPATPPQSSATSRHDNTAQKKYCREVPAHGYRRIAQWMQQAATAVHFAHEHNVLHRDLKPSNFLIDGSHRIWLTDFGLARRSERTAISLPGQAPGTLRYMSPEHCDGEATKLSDVYSLGVTLYEMLALTPAFSDNSPRSLRQRIRTGEYPPLRSHDPDIPRDLIVITEKAMALQPQDRYLSAQELANDLQRFVDGRPIMARPVAAPELAWRLICQHKTFTASILFTTVLLASLFTLLIYNSYLYRAEQESTFRKLITEAIDVANSRQPGQRTKALSNYAAAMKIIRQTPALNYLLEEYRSSLTSILDTPEILVPEVPRAWNLKSYTVSRDFRRIIESTADGKLNVRDAENDGRLLATIPEHIRPLDYVVSQDACCLLVSGPAPKSPDEKLPVEQQTPETPQQLTCWDLTADNPVLRWKVVGTSPTGLAFLPGGQQFVAADADGSILRFDLQTGTLLQHYPCVGPLLELQLRPHPHQPILAVIGGSYHEICFLNLKTGLIERRLPRYGISGFDWHPSGQQMAFHDELMEIELAAWPSLKSVKTFAASVGLTHCRFSPDGRWLAASAWSSVASRQPTLLLIRIEDGYTLTSPWIFGGTGVDHAWSLSGDNIGLLWHNGHVVKARLNDPDIIRKITVDQPGFISTPSITASRQLPLVAANVRGIPGLLLNLQTGTTFAVDLPIERSSALTYVSDLMWSETGLTSADFRGNSIWQIHPQLTDNNTLLLQTESRLRLPLRCEMQKLSPDGRWIFTRSLTGQLQRSPTDNPFAVQLLPPDLQSVVSVSSSGRYILCSRHKATSILFDCQTRTALDEFPGGTGATFSPDEKLVLLTIPDPDSPALQSEVRRLADSSLLFSLPAAAEFADFSSSGKMLAVCCSHQLQRELQLLDVPSGQILLTLPLKADHAGGVLFADHDQRLFIHSIGQTSSSLYCLNLLELAVAYSQAGLPGIPVAAPSTPANTPQTAGVSHLRFSPVTTPLPARTLNLLARWIRSTPATQSSTSSTLTPLLANFCCDALELGCYDVVRQPLHWLQQLDAHSPSVTALQASLLLRQKQPQQALQLLQQSPAARLHPSCLLNELLALSEVETPARTRELMASLKDAAESDFTGLLLRLLNDRLQRTGGADRPDSKTENSDHWQPAPPTISDLNRIQWLLLGFADIRSAALALDAAQQATQKLPASPAAWQTRALAEIHNGLPVAALQSITHARQLNQNRDDATLQLIEASIHLYNEDFPAWFSSLLKIAALLKQNQTGSLLNANTLDSLPLTVTLQVPVRSDSVLGRLYRWQLLAESQLLGRTHIDRLLNTRSGH